MNNNLYALNETGNIILSIVFILLIGGLSFLLARSVIKVWKTEKEQKEEKIISDLASKNQLTLAIQAFITRYRRDNECSLFLFELEEFGNIKEAFGSAQAVRFNETILKNVKKILPSNALLADYDDYQYAVLLRGKISRERLEMFAAKLVEVIQTPLQIPTQDGGNVTISTSMGVTVYPENGNTPVELYKNVEIALYMAKKETKERYVMFNADASKTEEDNLKYYREIKEAMRNKQFTLYYQPMVDTKANNIIGFESLLRWNHPTLGVLSPNKFLNVLEMSGDISWVGKWGIESICKQYNEWKKLMPGIEFMVSFNLSPKQLLDPNLPSDFLAVCRRYKMDCSKICLEIYEFAMFEKYSIITENINKLAQEGFTIAIDDFGLEANSLARLASLPIKVIKFEKSFMDYAKSNFIMSKLLESIVTMANDEQNKKILLAESVETVDRIKEINALGIYGIQGYVFSKPMDAKNVEHYIKSKEWRAVMSELEDSIPELPDDTPFFQKK